MHKDPWIPKPNTTAATLRPLRVDTYHRQRGVDLDETEGGVLGTARVGRTMSWEMGRKGRISYVCHSMKCK